MRLDLLQSAYDRIDAALRDPDDPSAARVALEHAWGVLRAHPQFDPETNKFVDSVPYPGVGAKVS